MLHVATTVGVQGPVGKITGVLVGIGVRVDVWVGVGVSIATLLTVNTESIKQFEVMP
jgi:hypothetical protein